MASMDNAWTLLRNNSLVEASVEAYRSVSFLDVWFFPILFLFTLFVVAIKTENPGYVMVYALIGNVALVGFMTNPLVQPVFYTTIVLSFTMVLWSFFGSGKIDN